MAELTRYKGYYINTENGVRYGINYTYNMVDGKMINEKETSKTKLSDVNINR